MEKKLILHAGSQKTGTTGLQLFLAANEEILLEKHNIYIPKIERCCPGNARMLTNNIFPFPEITKKLFIELKNNEGRIFLISDEDISWLKQCNKNFINEFCILFPDYKIDVIYYLRRIDDYMRSLYSHCIKDSYGFLHPYSNYSYFDFCGEKLFSNDSSKCSFLPSEEISYLHSLFGKENVTIRLYDKNALLHGNIVDDFFSLFNISMSGDKHRLVNPTIKGSLLSHIRNNLLLDLHGSQFTETITLLAERASVVSQDVSQINAQFLPRAKEEIDKISALFPPYRDLFKHRPCDISFDELGTCDHENVFHSTLLYSVFGKIEKISNRLDNISNSLNNISNRLDNISYEILKAEHVNNVSLLQSAYLAAVRLRGQKCYFWGCGAAYEQQKTLFAGARPKAILVDMIPASGLKKTVDGLPVLMAQDVLGKEKNILPIVLFSRTIHTPLIMKKIATLYPQYFEQLVVCPPVE